MKFTIFALSLFSVSAFGFTLSSPSNSNFKGWATTEIKFQFNPANCPSNVDVNDIIDEAFALWNDVSTSNVKVSLVGETTSTTYSDPITIVCDTNYANGDAATQASSPGVASSLPGVGDYITSGLMSLNASAGAANIGNLSTTKVVITLAHEIGHLLGIGHSQDLNALMYYDISQKTTLSLAQDDIDAVTYLYPRNESLTKPLGCATVNFDQGPNSGGGPTTLLILALPLLVALILRKRYLSRV